MMNYRQLLQSITPGIYRNLKRAVEIGKWPDGRKLTDQQRQLSLQAIIAYDARQGPEAERVGQIHRPSGKDCTRTVSANAGDSGATANQPEPLKWR